MRRHRAQERTHRGKGSGHKIRRYRHSRKQCGLVGEPIRDVPDLVCLLGQRTKEKADPIVPTVRVFDCAETVDVFIPVRFKVI